MWKIALAFAVFAVVVVWVLGRAGGDIDMGGEKHGVEAVSPAAGSARPQARAWRRRAPSARPPTRPGAPPRPPA